MPALFTSPSMRPFHFQARSASSGMRAKSVASKGSTRASLQPFATASSAATLRPERTRLAPFAARARASASPMPDEAPVIHQQRPLNGSGMDRPFDDVVDEFNQQPGRFLRLLLLHPVPRTGEEMR